MLIKPGEEVKLSIRSIKLDGGTELEGQFRGTGTFTVEYWMNVTIYNPETGKKQEVAISKNTLILNGQFKDEEFKEAILYFKKLAVKALKETNSDHGECIDRAIDKINAGE
jgi:hypothetical protein